MMKFPFRFATTSLGIVMVLTVACNGMGGVSVNAPTDRQTTEANITRLTTGLLEQSQFAHHPFDSNLANTLLDRYVDSLDGARSLFLQKDIDDLAPYRVTLAQDMRKSGDTRAEQAVFQRYLARLEEQTSYMNNVLRTANFDFTGHDTYSFDREHAARPRDLAAAQALWLQQLRSEYLTEKLRDKTPEQIGSTLTRRHDQMLASMKSLRSDEVLDIYLDTLAHVYDPHSDYLGREDMEGFSIGMNLSLVGIGASLESTDGTCKIRELIPGGPAARGGLLKPGDRIVAVAQAGQGAVDIVNMPLSRSVPLIRGPKGTTVTLTVIPAGAADGSPSKTVAIVRDEVKLEDQEAKARILDLPTEKGQLRIGIIDLPSFYQGTEEGPGARSATADVARLLTKLKAEHVQGIVLDLRKNPGGSLGEAISMSGLFIRKGPVVQTRDQAGKIEVDSDNDPSELYDGPLVLLTSRFSASATEIMAGALQDYGRALVVGDPSTFGKGTVQSVLPLARIMDAEHLGHSFDPGALKVTIDKFYRPSGASTQLRGVTSDIVLPSLTNLADVNESSLKDPLPWDTVPPAEHDAYGRVRPYVVTLRASSAKRVGAEEEFKQVSDEIARVRKNIATKSVSLNEAERRAELADAKTRQAEREREERALHASTPSTYEITLENASKPGLPAPGERAERAPLPDDRDQVATARFADDTVLQETEKVLVDYVGLLHQELPATSRAPASAMR